MALGHDAFVPPPGWIERLTSEPPRRATKVESAPLFQPPITEVPEHCIETEDAWRNLCRFGINYRCKCEVSDAD